MTKLQLWMAYAFTSVLFLNLSPLGSQTQADWLVTPLSEPEAEEDGESFEDNFARLTSALREETKQSAKLDRLKWANLKDMGSDG